VRSDVDVENFLTASLILDIKDQAKFFHLLSRIPNDVERHFRASRVYVFVPGKGLDSDPNEFLFDVRLRIDPVDLTNERTARKAFNAYFDDIRKVIEREIKGNP
jgi:hypothetical protein